MIAPGLIAEVAGCQMLEAGAKIIPQNHIAGRVSAMVRDFLVIVPCHTKPNAFEPSTAGVDLFVQHIGGSVADL